MFCPNYKNKFVFDGFNEMIEAFGGRPMTEDEFRSASLRNLRTGQDYLAMEAAYITYNRNGGNFLDETPLGKPSLLFLTLLSHFGNNRSKAIVAKSNVYSDEFINWFGDWGGFKTIDTKSNLFTPTGEVNWNYFELLLDSYHNSQPDSMFSHGRYTLATRPENHFTGEKNTLNHIKFVTQSMLNLFEGKYDMDLPFVSEARASMQNQKDLMILAAMFHDAAKPYRHGDIHGWESADILRDLLGVDYDNRVAEWAVRHHMPMPFSHKAEFSLSNPEAIEVAKNIARDAKRVGINANTAINAFVLINAADVINGRELDVDDNWAKKAGEEGLKKYGGDISVKNVLSVELKEKVALLKKAFDEIKDEDFGDTAYNYSHQERFDYNAFPEGGREDKKLPYLNNTEYTGVSKVVDENGEPLVVWHYTDNTFEEFDDTKQRSDAIINKPKYSGFYFSDSKEYASVFGNIGMPVYLKMEYPFDREQFKDNPFARRFMTNGPLEISSTAISWMRRYLLNDNSIINGAIGRDAGFKDETWHNEYVVFNPNQIKHVENLGTWNPKDKNIYHLKRDISFDEDSEYFKPADIVSSFGQELSQKLMNGETVSSRDLMRTMLANGMFHSVDNKLARALSLHDVPVRIGYAMKNGELAKTVTDGPASVIFINPNELNQVSRGYAGVTIMHELVHAITVDIINHPKTQADFEFVKANRDAFDRITKHIKHLDVHSRNVIDGMYAFTNEKEFAACFASDPVVRALICGIAEKIDRLNRKSGTLAALKNLVNKIAKAFGKRAIFSETSLLSNLEDYEKILTDYLIGAPIIERGNTDNSKLKLVYANSNKSLLNHEDFIESMKMLEKMQEVEKNYLASAGVQVHKIEEVQEMLNTRVLALKASLLDSVEKGRLVSTTENLLEMFVIDEVGKYNAIQNLLKTAVPAMIETVDKLRAIRRENGVFTNSDYMREMHANVGMYNKAFDTILSILVDSANKSRIVEEYNKHLNPDQQKLTIDDIFAMEQSLKNAKSFSEEAMHILEYMLKENGIHTLKKKAKEVGYKGIDKYIDAINGNSVLDDISSLELIAGASDASANDAVRAISYMINSALSKAQFATQDKLTDLLRLLKNLKHGEKGWHLYETDENGNFTGYLIRDLNFGRFKRDYIEAIHNINKDLIKYFGLATLSVDSRVAPDGEAGKRTADIKITDKKGNTVIKTYTAKLYFEEKKDEWLNAHCERKYKPEYYEHYSKLPQRIKDQLGAIRTQIESITSNYKNLYDADGVPHYELLSDEDWDKLNKLWERRRFLRSPINEYGFEREGLDREDAEALANLYEELYNVPNPFKKKRDNTHKEKQYKKDKWLKARNEIISKYGKDSEELSKWDQRNSIKTLKKNEFGEALVFLEIEKEFGDFKINYGEAYEELKLKKKDILSKYRMLNGEYDANSIPQVLLNALIELDRKMYSERYKSQGTDAARIAKFKEIWDKYIKYVDTEQLKRAKEEARKEAQRLLSEIEDIDDETTENELMNIILGNTYGYITFDDDLFDIEGTFVPYSWLLRMETVDESFMEISPNDAWIDKQESDLLNHNFDESYNMSYVPKRELYDNEKNYSKIFGEKDENGVRHGGSETLKALYNGIFDTIHEANQMQNREFADDYLLPLQECTAMERLYRKSTYKGFKNFLSKLFGFGRIIGLSEDPNDTDINTAYLESSVGRILSISGVYPDGREFHVIPTPFTKPLEHPELISKDIVGITRDYYMMSCQYKERSIIRDDCELILDLIRDLKFKNSDRFGKFRKVTDKIKLTGGNNQLSNTFNYARKLIERDLYDMQRDSFGLFGIDLTKILSLLKRMTTARNLGMNPKVAMVGFFTTMFTHVINGIVGYKYSKSDMFNAGLITLNEFGSNFAGARFIGDRLTKNKLILLMELMDLSDQSGKKSEHSNRNRILLAIYKNSTFGIMSAADIYSKATIMVATLLSYRYVNGLFMTKHMIEELRLILGEEKYKLLMKEFKNSKVNAYNIFEGDSEAWKLKINSNDTKLRVKPEYQAAWEKIKNTASNKAMKNAEQADGMATRLQKALMTRNFLGAFVLIHRQYIPLMLQQTWGKRVYDFDAEEYKGGQFRTLFNYCRNLWASNALAAAGAGAFVGLAFGGFSPIFLAGCGTISLATSLVYNIKHRKDRKSLKNVNDEFFGTGLGSVLNPFGVKFSSLKEGQSLEEHDNLVANAYLIRQTFYEVMLINFAIAPIANLLVACADNTDKDDDRLKWLLLQTLAYWARAVQFETNSKYNLIDILNNVKSATAATSVSDALLTFTSGMGTSLFMSTLGYGRNYASQSIVSGIYRLALNFFNDEESELEEDDGIVQNGTYQGYTEGFRNFMKTIPFHNIFELFVDPAAKRRYNETQVMKLDKFERYSLLYDLIWGYNQDDED